MRPLLRSLLAILAGASGLAAQGGDVTAIAGPQFVSYTIGSGATGKTVSQMSVPFAFIMPLGERFSFDVSGAWARSAVSSNGSETSSINGLTDTQARFNWTLGDNFAVITLGANVATGQYKVKDAQQEAAGQIGSNFLLYPISSMGSGNSFTGGVAFAWSAGDWNIGLGGSYRKSSPFDAFEVSSTTLRFEPGSEARLRFGVDHAVGEGRFTLAGTYSNYTDDKVDSTTFATGARTIGQAGLYMPTSWGDWTVSAWDLYRAAGERVGDVAPAENIVNGSVALGFNIGDAYLSPSIEARSWTRDSQKAGQLITAGARLKFNVGPFSVNPSASYSFGGKVYVPGTTTSLDVTGYRAMLLIRLQ